MSQKKRRFQQLEAAAAVPQEKKRYTDPFQERVAPRIEDFGKKFEGKGKTILYGFIALVIIAIIGFAATRWSRSSGGAAQAALGKAIETSQAQISETPPIAGTTQQKTYKTEKERTEAAISEFQAVAEKFRGDVAEKARYFIAVNKLNVDRPAAITELEGLSANSSDAGKLAKFALAQTKAEDNKLDEAAALYQELAGMNDAIVAKDTINFELAKVYEKQGKTQEAADLYFNIAKTASELKDLDDKPVMMSETAKSAKEKLKAIDVERAAQIVEPTPESPVSISGAGGLPISVKPN